MAVLNGKRYFSWVQCSRDCIHDPARVSANSTWQLAISQTNFKANPNTVCADLRSSAARNGGRS